MADLKVMTQPNSFTASFFSLNWSSINETLIKSIFIYTSAITSYLQNDGFLLQSDTSGISGSDTELMEGNYHIKILLWCFWLLWV